MSFRGLTGESLAGIDSLIRVIFGLDPKIYTSQLCEDSRVKHGNDNASSIGITVLLSIELTIPADLINDTLNTHPKT